MTLGRPIPIVVLISGRGSNLEAIHQAATDGAAPIAIRGVISSLPRAAGIEKARRFHIPARVLTARDETDRQAYDEALAALVDEFAPELLVLAGFMRVLMPAFVRRYAGRILNIHPSLLPRHRGLHTHRRVLEAGDRVHGASVHFVTEDLDGGPVIAQAEVPVLSDDDEHTLEQRVLAQEHILYPRVIGWYATGRLRMREGSAWLNGERLTEPLRLPFSEIPP